MKRNLAGIGRGNEWTAREREKKIGRRGEGWLGIGSQKDDGLNGESREQVISPKLS